MARLTSTALSVVLLVGATVRPSARPPVRIRVDGARRNRLNADSAVRHVLIPAVDTFTFGQTLAELSTT
ncbi:hypothetical protein [Streptomyces sp. NEAU-W12]|uniref:hypothetical protein n=1 Tax=Streptomyces sp. NEAU-W12 TaxID=2994668 RepID=UPI00224B4A8E|nr:hypothetical protein [Streptomyces sp. NEAU-W12]MCX2925575.1 hypothetical protein [Streptomyces sp. NEAU-W12]